MMALHEKFPVAWGPERMEGLTLDLGLDGIFCPLPPDLNVESKETDSEPSWSNVGQSQKQNVDGMGADSSVLFRRSSGLDRKPELLDLSLTSPVTAAEFPVSAKVENEDVEPGPRPLTMRLPTGVASERGNERRRDEYISHERMQWFGGEAVAGASRGFPVIDSPSHESKPDIPQSSSLLAGQRADYPILLDGDSDEEAFCLAEGDDDDDNQQGIGSSPRMNGQCGQVVRDQADLVGAVKIEECDRETSFQMRDILPQHGQDEKGWRLSERPIDSHGSASETFSDGFENHAVRESKRARVNSDTVDRRTEMNQAIREMNPEKAAAFKAIFRLVEDSTMEDSRAAGDPGHCRADFAEGDDDDDDQQAIGSSPRMNGQRGQVVRYRADLVGAVKIEECDRETSSHMCHIVPQHGQDEQGWRLSKRSIDSHGSASETFSDGCEAVYESRGPTRSQPGFGCDSSDPVTECGSRNMAPSLIRRGDPFFRECASPGTSQAVVAQSSCESLAQLATSGISSFAAEPDTPAERAHSVQKDICRSQDQSHSAVRDQPFTTHQQAPVQEWPTSADMVLYEPKLETAELQMDQQLAAQQHSRNVPPDIISFGPLAGPTALGPSLSPRKIIFVALHAFDQVRRHIILNPTYGQNSTDIEQKDTRLRADLKAASLMRRRGFWLNTKVRPIGEVPGVLVGDRFNYRIEMAVIGLHRATQAGIAIVPAGFSPYRVPVASSVVLGSSDPYHDDVDMGDVVIYSGQGGLCGKTKESQDQQLKRGNLALKNSYERDLPIRLIRGHRMPNGLTATTYSYDGLYKIHEMKYVDGVSGKKVFLFTMRRLPGQASLQSDGTYPVPLLSQPPAEQIELSRPWTQVPKQEPDWHRSGEDQTA